MGGIVGCCASRDINDRSPGIEVRNDQFFIFNYPNLLREIDKRLIDATQPGRPNTSDVNYFKWVLSQLLLEIDYNEKSMQFESQQNQRRRLVIEVCNGNDFIKPFHNFSKPKCIVRMQLKNHSKQTKKNINCTNPKFYEIFKLQVENNYEQEEILIFVIIVDQNEDWHIIAREQIKLSEFSDQLVHMQFMNMPAYKVPIKVNSEHFKFKEISDFSFEEEGIEIIPPPLDTVRSIQTGKFAHFLRVGNIDDKINEEDEEDGESLSFNIDNYIKNYRSEEVDGILQPADESSSDLYAKENLKLTLRVQLLSDSINYLKTYIKDYQDKFHMIQKFLDEQNILLH